MLLILFLLNLSKGFANKIDTGRKIMIYDGKIKSQGYDNCTFEREGIYYHWQRHMGPIKGLWFGTIKYSCNGETGYVESELQCITSGIYNSLNDQITGCEQTWLKVVLGIMIGIFAFMIFFIVDLKYHLVTRSYQNCSKYLYYKKLTSQDKEDAFIMKGNARLYHQKAEDKFADYNKDQLGKKREANLKAKRIKRIDKINNKFITSAVILCLIGSACSFDKTLYITTEGLYCKNSKCEKYWNTRFPLSTGSTIQFVDENDQKLTLKFENFFEINYYRAIYYTSDYIIKTISTVECYADWFMGSESNCYDGSCKKATNFYKSSFDKFLPTDKIAGYGCAVDSLGCENKYCYIKQRCVFYKWILKEQGPRALVFLKESQGWVADFSLSHKNLTRKISVNVANIMELVHMEDWKIKIPLLVSSPNYQQTYTTSKLMKYEDKYYYVEASSPNEPGRNILGDYQVDYRNSTEVFDMGSVDCEAAKCSIFCYKDDSPIKRFLKYKNNIKRPKRTEIIEDVVIASNAVSATVDITISSEKIRELDITPAYCLFEQTHSFACTGCNEQGYISFSTKNMRTPGLITFTSNCSFDFNYVACQERPFNLYFRGQNPYCELYFLATNQTIHTSVKSIFKGTLYPFELQRSQYEEFMHIAESPEFLSGIFGTFMTCTALTFLSTFLFNIVKMYFQYKQVERSTQQMNDTGAQVIIQNAHTRPTAPPIQIEMQSIANKNCLDNQKLNKQMSVGRLYPKAFGNSEFELDII
nr:TPA_asm: glycoprotein [Bunya-like virus atrichopogon]